MIATVPPAGCNGPACRRLAATFGICSTAPPADSGRFYAGDVSLTLWLRRVSLWQADRPERVLKPAGRASSTSASPGPSQRSALVNSWVDRAAPFSAPPSQPTTIQDMAHNNPPWSCSAAAAFGCDPIWFRTSSKESTDKGVPMSLIGFVGDVALQRG